MNTLATAMLQRTGGALDISPRGIVGLIIKLVIFGIVFGLLYMLIDKAPFLQEPWKSYVKYVLYALVVIFVIYFLLGLVGAT